MSRAFAGNFRQRTCPGVTVARIAHTVGELALDDFTRSRLQRIVEAQRLPTHLGPHTMASRRRLLLAGPPGARQTMVAAALSGELGLPLIVIQLGALVAAHASKRERELLQVLDAIACLRGVYFIDGLDVPALPNAAANDAAPAHSMLDKLVRTIEEHHPNSLIVATGQPPERRNRSVAMHFDDVVEIHPGPSRSR
jgi:AAA+ superfamily predicted ATPase